MIERGTGGRTGPSGATGAAQARAAVASEVAHPLLRPFPLVVMALATFLVVFALMMARLTAGLHQTLRPGAITASLTEGSSAAVVRTRTSGSTAQSAPAVQAASAEGPSVTAPAIVTRASGGASGAGDE
jgi:hypothetical protein